MNTDSPIPDELWQQITPAAQAAIRALIQRYERRLADLEARLKQNSTNSFKPPSWSVVETCRRQSSDVWGYLTECVAAAAEGRTVSSLLTPPNITHAA
jgi:hypothetical protein